MSRGRWFVAGCCITIGIGIVFSMAGFIMGGKVTGVNVGPEGVAVYSADGAENGKEFTYQTGEEQLEEFDGIKIVANYADVRIQPAKHYGIAYNLDEGYRFSYEIKDGTLVVTQKKPTGINSDFSLFHFDMMSGMDEYYEQEFITVYVPEDSEFYEVDIKNASGDVFCGGFYADKLNVEADYGAVELEKAGSKTASIVMDSGNLEITSFTDGDILVENNYGDVILKDVKAGELNFKVDSGKLEASETTADLLTVEDHYGNIALQQVKVNGISLTANSGNISLEDVETENLTVYNDYGSVDGKNVKTDSFTGALESGNCKMEGFDMKQTDIKSDYGDVELELTAKVTDYSYALETEYGKITLGDKDMGVKYRSLEDEKENIAVYCESGDIQIEGAE